MFRQFKNMQSVPGLLASIVGRSNARGQETDFSGFVQTRFKKKFQNFPTIFPKPNN